MSDPTSAFSSGHNYSAGTIRDSARVQLGNINSYTYYFASSATKETVYDNVLIDHLRTFTRKYTLRKRKAENVYYYTASDTDKELSPETAHSLKSLEKSIARMQRVEQKAIKEAPSEQAMITQAASDDKVRYFIGKVDTSLWIVTTVAKRQCTDKDSPACMDDLCDLVDRLKRQIKARETISQSLSEVKASKFPTRETEARVVSNLEEHDADAPADNSLVSQDDYLYAARDFWREMATVLRRHNEAEVDLGVSDTILRTILPIVGIVVMGIPALILVAQPPTNKDAHTSPSIMRGLIKITTLALFAATTIAQGPFGVVCDKPDAVVKTDPHGKTAGQLCTYGCSREKGMFRGERGGPDFSGIYHGCVNKGKCRCK